MGKREKVEQAPVRRRLPVGAWILIAAAVILMMVGGVVAYLSATTGAVTNDFTADKVVNPTIEESFDGTTKTNVKVNVGNPGYGVYVRAAIVVTWKDAGGNVLGTAPVAGTDYEIAFGSGWFKGADGYYYHKAMVESGVTSDLIVSCKPIDGKTPAGYGLDVEIMAQIVQALGTTDTGNTPAVTDEWKITIDSNKQLVDPTPNP